MADTQRPLEEVSVVGKGRFARKELTALYTVKILPTGESKDNEEGTGILYLEGESTTVVRK